MKINGSKTTLVTMFANKNKLLGRPRTYLDYPFANKFKVLGTLVDNNLGINSHLSQIKSKFSYICKKLTPVRMLKDFRLNSNLFTTIIQPLFRLTSSIY